MIDAREEENKYVEKKYRHKKDFIDMEVRNSFQMSKVTISMIKYAHGYNHHRLRDAMINNYVVEAHCPRCNLVEIWDHIIKCRETISLRKEFIKGLVVELVKNKLEDINMEVIMSFVEDILRYLENKEEEE